MSKIVHTPVIRDIPFQKTGAETFSLTAKEFNEIADIEKAEFFTIDLFMKSPTIISWPWICFDGIISQLLLNLSLDNMFYNLNTHKPIKSKVKHYIKSPILHDPVPTTSVIQWYDFDGNLINPKYDVTRHIVTKKFCDDYSHLIRTKTKYILKAGGEYLNFFLRLPAILGYRGRIDIFGDMKATKLLLEFLNGIGKKIGMGNGAIHRIEYKKTKKEKSFYDYEKRISLRPIPIRFLKSYDQTKIGRCAWKPPYWSKDKLEMCVPPFTECELIDD